jgi:hypothetical protein
MEGLDVGLLGTTPRPAEVPAGAAASAGAAAGAVHGNRARRTAHLRAAAVRAVSRTAVESSNDARSVDRTDVSVCKLSDQLRA